MRTLFFAFALTTAFAGGAGAQERVRTGDLPAAAQAAPAARATPARVSGQAKSLRGSTAKAAPGARASVWAARGTRPMPARAKRPAPRG